METVSTVLDNTQASAQSPSHALEIEDMSIHNQFMYYILNVHVLSLIIPLSPVTLTRSTGWPDSFNSSKSCAFLHSTAANVDWEVELEYSKNEQGMRVHELMSCTVDTAGVGNEYETPSSVAATALTGEVGNAADEPVYSDIQ